MVTKDAFKQKIEAEIEVAQTKLAGLKAQAKNSVADAHIKYMDHVAALERELDTTKMRLKELSDANEDSWERLKEGVESTWDSLSVSIRDCFARFKK